MNIDQRFRGLKGKKIFAMFAVLFFVSFLVFLTRDTKGRKKQKMYVCKGDESIIRPKPGKCPLDGTPLVEKDILDGMTFTCRMHPEVKSKKPGKCPKCGMWLVPEDIVKKGSKNNSKEMNKMKYQSQKEATKEGKQLYTCPMHPSYISDKPGVCPICGMTLVPLKKGEMDPKKIKINPVVQQNMGIRTDVIRRKDVSLNIDVVGIIDYDERRLYHVNMKLNGWIERLFADYESRYVRKGEVLFEFYSPEAVASEEELLTLLKGNNSKSLIEAVERRFSLWDIPGSFINRVKEGKKIKRIIPYRSKYYGYIIKKNAFEGMHFKKGTMLYEIADLSRVWVYASVYEYQLPWLQNGLEADLKLPYFPSEVFKGKVVYIYQYLENKTRTVRVRLEFKNKDLKLKPGMYANVTIKSPVQKGALFVPREAVLRTGKADYVFVEIGEGQFEKRKIVLSKEVVDEGYIVKSGLKEGERIVLSGQFMLDSESQLKEAAMKMMKKGLKAPSGGHTH